ncbi:3-methyladenine DNA glycosylase [Demequina sp.]|uniref:3-methyladenine DNA glycosylase n=1 Tax=Demequina sp. TaxID=2050685 RepID=UPI003D0D7D79
MKTLAEDQWRPRAQAFERRADALTADRRERVARGQGHAVDDFLYEYYPTRPSLLRRWHPGVGVSLEGAHDHAGWRWYRSDAGVTSVDAVAFCEARGATVDFVTGLVAATLTRRAALGCFGLHEWAMVYRDRDTRHALPLRLGAEGTDQVVASHDVVCTHFDAYRFFTEDAVPRNAHALSRETQSQMEQPGCLHATMDLFKWCSKLAPAVPSELTLDAFELAVEVRRLDMAASPYDVSGLGLEALRIETPDGKRDYAARQREFSTRGEVLRRRLLDACDAIRREASEAADARTGA